MTNMADITISSVRIRSMFENRHYDLENAEESLELSKPLSEITTRDTALTFEDIQVLAKYFKKPWSYLLIDSAETFAKYKNDNRTRRNVKAGVSDETIDAVQNAEYLLETASEVFPDDVVQKPSIEKIKGDPKKLAHELRSFLGVSTKEQLGARDEYAALRLWSDAVQNRGVYVLQRHLDDHAVRAFSLTDEDYAVIVVDTVDTPYARIYSLLHEYCHVVLNTTGLCDLDQHSEIERYCNALTSYILLPDELIKQELEGLDLNDSIESAERHVISLSNHFRVSQAALLIRLNEAKKLSDTMYEQLEIRRKNRRAPARKSEGGDYYATAISSIGRKYASNVLGALSDGKINRTDASVLLGVGEHLVSRFKDELSSRLNGATT